MNSVDTDSIIQEVLKKHLAKDRISGTHFAVKAFGTSVRLFLKDWECCTHLT